VRERNAAQSRFVPGRAEAIEGSQNPRKEIKAPVERKQNPRKEDKIEAGAECFALSMVYGDGGTREPLEFSIDRSTIRRCQTVRCPDPATEESMARIQIS
jgi:hypothetical protein